MRLRSGILVRQSQRFCIYPSAFWVGFSNWSQFYNTSLKIEHKCSDAVCSSYNIYSAIALAYESSPKRALGFSDRHTTWMDRKVPMEACKGHPMRFAPSVMAGNMGVITALMPESLMAEMLVKESVWSVAVLASLMLEAMYAGNVPLLKRWNEMFEKAHFYLDDATTFVFSGVKGMGAVLINLSSQPHGAEIVENINDMVIRMGRVKLETNHSFVFKHVIVVFMACNVVVQRIRNSPEIDFVANNRLST
ncbi:hypothetical protein BC829DRAFT_296295 [Chytridium lagenaria]|nr:hypothetical protein BC829DRAFT_296295 [Chytridium lagenaria]